MKLVEPDHRQALRTQGMESVVGKDPFAPGAGGDPELYLQYRLGSGIRVKQQLKFELKDYWIL
jgi:hypothetical protein